MTQALEKLIDDKLQSLLSEGVDKFPKPLQSQDPVEQISTCTRCPLSQTRKRVVVSTQLTTKRFFVLSEFPTAEDETQTHSTFSEKSSSGVITKLLDKLGITQNCHLSFALKCTPDKGIPVSSISLCAQNNLTRELKTVQPEVILCFGSRGLLALSCLDKKISQLNLSENYSSFEFEFDNQTKKVFFLSSSTDLQTFPYWRGQVWQFLEHFKNRNE